MLRLKNIEAKEYRGKLRYQIILDTSAGVRKRYTLSVPTVDDPVIIGRELTITDIRRVIAYWENHLPFGWMGGRRSLLLLLKKYRGLNET